MTAPVAAPRYMAPRLEQALRMALARHRVHEIRSTRTVLDRHGQRQWCVEVRR